MSRRGGGFEEEANELESDFATLASKSALPNTLNNLRQVPGGI